MDADVEQMSREQLILFQWCPTGHNTFKAV